MNYQNNSRAIMLGLVTLGGLLGAVFLGNAAAKQDLNKIAFIIGGIFAVLIFLNLGNRYWYAIPVTLGLDLPTFQLGARNINLGELAIVGCSLLFIVRLALKNETLVLFRARNIPILLFIAWVTMVFAMNPVGLAGFGSEMGGARFYLQVYMGLAAFIIVSSQKIAETDLRWIFGLLIVGSFLDFGRTLFEYFVLGRRMGVVQMELDATGTYTWHQQMSAPALFIVFILFSRWSPSKIFSMSHVWRAALYFAAFPAVLMSGKRAAVAQLVLIPLISATMWKEFRYYAIFAVAGVIALCGLLYGQGNLFHLSLTTQRALSWLPADWDPEMQGFQGGSDQFRTIMREYAWEEIVKNPLIGKGFAIDIKETSATYYAQMTYGMGDDPRAQMLLSAMGKSWHNVWLGYAADFGIPLSIIQAFIYGVGLFTAWQVFKVTPANSLFKMMAAFVFLTIFRDLLASHTSGHTALDAFSRWWMYGMVFAMARQFLNRKFTQPPPDTASPNSQNFVPAAPAQAK